MTGSAWSIPLSQVGGVDTLLASTTLASSGDTAQMNWVLTQVDLVPSYLKYDNMTWEQVTDGSGNVMSGVYAIDFRSTQPPAYFYIKTGNTKNQEGTNLFLYQNIGELDWGVINLAALGITNLSNISIVSHIGEVPEPATILLLGFGLIGIAGIGRKKFNA
jgi:hypothetical protein